MEQNRLIEIITQEIIKVLKEQNYITEEKYPSDDNSLMDIASPEFKSKITIEDPQNALAVKAMKKTTTARIGIGRSGPRLNTKSLLSLRADHAMAKDAVLRAVDEKMLSDMGLFIVNSCCRDINEHLTRPDLGRKLPEESRALIEQKCVKSPQVQIYISDGLSNSAVIENIPHLLPILLDGLNYKGIKVGTPFYVRYGRVPTMDVISELTDAEVTCVLLGERPGLAASDSMSAYITYKAKVGISEAKRTVISNIHKNGIQPVEAGAYLVDAIIGILEKKDSGVQM